MIDIHDNIFWQEVSPVAGQASRDQIRIWLYCIVFAARNPHMSPIEQYHLYSTTLKKELFPSNYLPDEFRLLLVHSVNRTRPPAVSYSDRRNSMRYVFFFFYKQIRMPTSSAMRYVRRQRPYVHLYIQNLTGCVTSRQCGVPKRWTCVIDV